MPRTRLSTQIETQASLIRSNKQGPIFYCNHTSREVFRSGGKTGMKKMLLLLSNGRWMNTDDMEICYELPKELGLVYNEVVF
jgi:hypothetical protein